MCACLCVSCIGSFVRGAFGDQCIKPHHGGDGFFYLGLLVDSNRMIGAHRAPGVGFCKQAVHITVNQQQMRQDMCMA